MYLKLACYGQYESKYKILYPVLNTKIKTVTNKNEQSQVNINKVNFKLFDKVK